MGMETDLPAGWVPVKFGEIFDLNYGKGLVKAKRNSNGQFPVYGSNGKVGFHDSFLVDKPCLIIGRKGAVGSVRYSKTPCWPIDTTYFVVSSQFIFSKFLFFLLLSLRLEKLEKSTAIPGLSRQDVYKENIILPPLGEQRRIVAKIEELFSELDKGVESLKTALEKLKLYRQSLLKHAFEGKLTEQWRKENPDKLESPNELLSRIQREREERYQERLVEWEAKVEKWELAGSAGKRPTKPKKLWKAPPISETEKNHLPDLPSEWLYIRLGQLIDQIEAGKSFRCREIPPTEKEFGVAKVSAVTWGEYDELESKTCIDPGKFNKDFLIEKGDFLISRANTIELVGACVIARNVQKSVMLSDKTLRLHFLFYADEFFLHYLRSVCGRKEIMERSTGNQESMRNIGQDRIRMILVPVCGKVESEGILSQINDQTIIMDRLQAEIENQLEKSKILRQSILQKAFSGQLVPQDPTDEPAAVLLERIKAEKEAQAQKAKAARAKAAKPKTRKTPRKKKASA